MLVPRGNFFTWFSSCSPKLRLWLRTVAPFGVLIRLASKFFISCMLYVSSFSLLKFYSSIFLFLSMPVRYLFSRIS